MEESKVEIKLYKQVYDVLERYETYYDSNMLNLFSYQIQFNDQKKGKTQYVFNISSHLSISASWNKDISFPEFYEILNQYEKVEDFLSLIKSKMDGIDNKYPDLRK